MFLVGLWSEYLVEAIEIADVRNGWKDGVRY